MRRLWKEEATGAVLEFLVETSAGRWLSVARMPRVEEAGEGKVSEGEEGGPGLPYAIWTTGFRRVRKCLWLDVLYG